MVIGRARALVQGSRAALARIESEAADAKMLAAKLLIRDLERSCGQAEPIQIAAAEFKVFSQFGEDGIIQYLVRRAQIPAQLRSFVEFGVESYSEANTRFLLLNDNWRGLIMDGDPANIGPVKSSAMYWRHDLTAKAAFVDRDNIDRLISSAGFSGEIGLLSIDIDGNDYWVWERVTEINPVIVIVEYNSVFGPAQAVSVPYDPGFRRSQAHYSHLYWGCSLRALEHLGRSRGYALVGSNSAGNNAFFVRRDRLNGQPELTAQQAYVESRFRESRDLEGRLNYLSGSARRQEIAHLPVIDVERDTTIMVGEIAA